MEKHKKVYNHKKKLKFLDLEHYGLNSIYTIFDF